jgi:hypothetical protein
MQPLRREAGCANGIRMHFTATQGYESYLGIDDLGGVLVRI